VISGVGVTTVSGTLNINTTGSMQTASIDILSGGAVNLDAGTLRVGGGGLGPTGRSIDNDSGSFNWGNGDPGRLYHRQRRGGPDRPHRRGRIAQRPRP
jgi:hypothetical protein